MNSSPCLDSQRLQSTFEKASRELLARRDESGHWTGRLSASALSTATAVSALSIYRNALLQKQGDEPEGPYTPDLLGKMIERALGWLRLHQNPDGGWGDTDKSYSNISTTVLVQSALILSGNDTDQQADAYITRLGGFDAVRGRYGADLTFSVPILTNAALAGLVPWKDIPQLPFHRAAWPRALFRFLNLQVVSYAIPALVAIGQVRFHHYRERLHPLRNLLQKTTRARTLRIIRSMQPHSGGFLEAAPLTAFVTMSLVSCGQVDHPLVAEAVRFLVETVREDGSWPIDTNLATWATSLSVYALGGEILRDDSKTDALIDWILSCQHKCRHPFTGADPGGWGWTDLSGAVPDADDTPGAIIALCELLPTVQNPDKRRIIVQALEHGIRWLLALRNRDGGIPTFCRGWGVLPFDKSSTDLTAHTIRAFLSWRRCREAADSKKLYEKTTAALDRMKRYLDRTQNSDGSWFPLWFGNQDHPNDNNPCYGTAKVLRALAESGGNEKAVHRGLQWLVRSQNPDGDWGSIEETAVVLEALPFFRDKYKEVDDAYYRGLRYLIKRVETDRWTASAPIGLYFAKLWYYEDLYPLIFTTTALRMARFFLLGMFVVLLALIGTSPWIAETQGADNPVRVLLVTGVDYAGHDWHTQALGIRKEISENRSIDVRLTEDIEVLGTDLIFDYDVLLLNFKNYEPLKREDVAKKNLLRFVTEGGGLMLFHFTGGAFQNWPEYHQIAGRVWNPKARGHDPYREFEVQIVHKDHPVMANIGNFRITDELYTCLEGNRKIEVLAEATSSVDQKTYAMAFVFTEGKGRVFHTPLGHNSKAFNAKELGQMLRNATMWCANRENEATPSTTTPSQTRIGDAP